MYLPVADIGVCSVRVTRTVIVVLDGFDFLIIILTDPDDSMPTNSPLANSTISPKKQTY